MPTNWAHLQHPRVIITAGDLNLNRMVPSSPEGKLLLDLEVEQGLKCMITKPTWIQMRGFLVTNHLELFENCGVYDPALSDHGLVYGFLNEMVKHQARQDCNI